MEGTLINFSDKNQSNWFRWEKFKFHKSYVTKKERVQEIHSPMRCSHSDPGFSHPYRPIHILVH
jgi:hypothetical protein